MLPCTLDCFTLIIRRKIDNSTPNFIFIRWIASQRSIIEIIVIDRLFFTASWFSWTLIVVVGLPSSKIRLIFFLDHRAILSSYFLQEYISVANWVVIIELGRGVRSNFWNFILFCKIYQLRLVNFPQDLILSIFFFLDLSPTVVSLKFFELESSYRWVELVMIRKLMDVRVYRLVIVVTTQRHLI